MKKSLIPVKENQAPRILSRAFKIDPAKATASPRKPLTPIQGKLGKAPENEMVGRKIPTATTSRSASNEQKTGADLGKPGPSRLKKIQTGFVSKKKALTPEREHVEKGVQTENCDVDLITGETAPPEYWKELAEERRLALEDALKENQKLTDRIEVLEAENRDLDEMLGEAKMLAEMINTMSGEAADESGIGKDTEVDTTLNTSTSSTE